MQNEPNNLNVTIKFYQGVLNIPRRQFTEESGTYTIKQVETL
jgi:hypothetical protein